MTIFLFLIVSVLCIWEYRPIDNTDLSVFNFCQYTTEPCSSPPSLPYPKYSHTAVRYTSWEAEDVHNLCPGEMCGPLCDYSDESCFIEDRDPKDPDDQTEGGRNLDLPSESESQEPIATIYNSTCPELCCESESCKRTHDIFGYEVPISAEFMVVFGGINFRDIQIEGVSLMNNCTEDRKAAALAMGIDIAFIENCGGVISNELWRYNFHNDTWQFLKPTYNRLLYSSYTAPYPRFAHAAVSVNIKEPDTLSKDNTTRKYMYVYGGFSLECGDTCEDFWRFEIPWAAQRYYPEVGEEESIYWNRGGYWESLTNSIKPGPRAKHSMVVDSSSTFFYLYGGIANDTFFDDLWKYNISANTWEYLTTYGITKVTRQVVQWDGASIELEVPISERLETDEVEYDVDGVKPVARASTSMVYWEEGEYILMFGGLGLLTEGVTYTLDDFWVLSLDSLTWTEIYTRNTGPGARLETHIVKLDPDKLMLFGGRYNDIVYSDSWMYSLETNYWYEWNELNYEDSDYPTGRTRAVMIKGNDSILLYGGFYSATADLAITDEYVENLDDSEIAVFEKDLKFLQGIWVLNMTTCRDDCFSHGTCQQAQCICDSEHYGGTCELTACPGTYCHYDSTFLTQATCLECSGNGNCIEGECLCDDGYFGDDCGFLNCTDACFEFGECVLLFPMNQCDCGSNYGGDDCQVQFCLNNCNLPHGTCDTSSGVCTCESGYYGFDCSIAMFSHSLEVIVNMIGVLLF